mmetsp:Transcript_94883/g.257542  ORF Transcript_94883/g.257542 Transcript_94883/m.257542 type:complete len:219 (-) Transcript_94883:220-876(-)
MAKRKEVTEEELAKHQEIPEENRFLEEEVEAYKKEVEKMQEKLVVAQRRKEALSADAQELRETNGGPTDSTFNHGEMNRFSVTVVDQLVKVEDELRQRTTELSELTGPFLRDAHGLLAALSASCSRLDGGVGAPPTYKASQGDAKHGLDGAVCIMRYCVEAMERCKTSGPASLTNLAREGSIKGKGKGKSRSKHEIVENDDDDDGWDLFSIGRRWGLV